MPEEYIGVDIREIMSENASLRADNLSLRNLLDQAERKLAYYERSSRGC